MDFLIKTVQVILALSILVLVHEMGHYLFARLFRIRVEKFYLFFNPGFSLFKYKPKNSDTEFGLGWLPLGGYCKISGMIDESMDKEALKKEPQPWEFRSKPAWQRFFVMFGGVLLNLFLAIIVYCGLLYIYGEQYICSKDATYGLEYHELAQEAGFQNGDIILAFDDKPAGKVHELQMELLYSNPKTITVLRSGEPISFSFDEKFIPLMLKARKHLFQIRVPFVIAEIPDSSANYGAGLMPGDRLLSLNQFSALTVQEAQVLLPQFAGDTITALFDRNGNNISLPLWVNHQGLIGVVLDVEPTHFFSCTKKEYTLLSSVPAGVRKAYNTVSNYLKDLGLIFSPKTEAYKSVGSVIAIGNIFPASWDWGAFWNITAFLSIMFAVLNLLPIPALDGGHILFVLFEMVTRRKPGDKFLEYAQVTGMVLLFAIMFLAFGNDILRLIN
jgi:regulator of sigma E protease